MTTTYIYTNGASLAAMDYSDGTPGVTNTYHRLGHQNTINHVLGTRTFAHNDALQLAAETKIQRVRGLMAATTSLST